MIQCLLNPVDCALSAVPWWIWAVLVLLAAGAIWKWVGWQGLVALAAGAIAFFGYRQGYRDGKSKAPPVVPVDDPMPVPPPEPPRRKRRTIFDMLRGQ